MLDAAILVGGRGRRLGGACKPLLEVRGRPILAAQLDALASLAALDGTIWLVGDVPPPDEEGLARVSSGAAIAARVRRLPDERPGAGPLAGLAAALRAATAEALVLLGGDMPTLQPAALALVAGARPDADVAVPFVDGRLEPLHARWARRLLPLVDARLARDRRSLVALLDEEPIDRALVDEAALRAVDPTLASLANVNTPDEWARARSPR